LENKIRKTKEGTWRDVTAVGPVTFGLCAELSGREKREKSEEGKRERSEIRTTKKKDLTRTHILMETVLSDRAAAIQATATKQPLCSHINRRRLESIGAMSRGEAIIAGAAGQRVLFP
jgi:hypothetical protein